MSHPNLAEFHAVELGRSRRKYWILASVILVALCLGVGGYIYIYFAGEQELNQAIAEADRLDPQWRLMDIEAQRAVIPDEENSALQILAARRLLPNNWQKWPVPEAGEPVPGEDDSLADEVRNAVMNLDMPPPVQLNERQVGALRWQLKEAASAVDAARKVATMPRGRYQVKWSKDFIGSLFPHIQEAREVANVLSYDAMLRAHDRQFDEALSSCQAILNVARSIGDEPTLISQLVRIACDSVALRKIERTLAQGEPPDSALAMSQKLLEEEAEAPLMLFGTRGERGGSDMLMEAIQKGDIKMSYLLAIGSMGSSGNFGSDQIEHLRMIISLKSQRGALLRHTTRMVEIAKLPPEEQQAEFKLLLSNLEDQPLIVRLIAPAMDKVGRAFLRKTAELCCGAVALAAERFRQAHGRWPGSLNELVPDYIKEVPKDPFDGQALRLRPFEQGVVIYSVGVDKEDNGGHLGKNPNERGSDIGVRLWDVQHRRQPAQPIEWPEDVGEKLKELREKEKPEGR